MKPSKYQQAIFEWIKTGRGDAAVNAVAGSGKTTTLVEASKLLSTDSALFLAFNKSIVEELQNRLGKGVTCKTINALGHGALAKFLAPKRLQLNTDKYRNIVRDLLLDRQLDNADMADAIKACCSLVSFAQSSLCELDDDSLWNLATHYGVEMPLGLATVSVFTIVRSALQQGEILGRQGIISFDDQIWLAVKWRLRPTQALFVMVDECQDLSKAKLELALAARAPGGRMLFVGDPRQSIYGFAGADCQSFQNILDRTGAIELPLSVSYRCPRLVVDVASTIVPDIEAAPGAPDGIVANIEEKELTANVQTGDLVLCRLTAPLVKLCIELIKSRIPARVKGRDIASSLVKLAKDALGKRYAWAQIDEALATYEQAKVEQLSQRKGGEAQIEALRDRIAGVYAILDGMTPSSFDEFKTEVEGLFTDGKAVVELSTVHRSKGLEASRVFIIQPNKLPLEWKGQQPWEYEQELNLEYVAYTRAKQALYIVREAAAKKKVA